MTTNARVRMLEQIARLDRDIADFKDEICRIESDLELEDEDLEDDDELNRITADLDLTVLARDELQQKLVELCKQTYG